MTAAFKAPAPVIDALDGASLLAGMGLPIFRLKAGSKLPFDKDWAKGGATVDAFDVFDRFSDGSFNVGVLCNGLVVIDVDVKGRVNGFDTLVSLGVPLPPTFTVRTGSGGAHFYYRADGFGQRPLGPGVDIRASNGYVVGPGSIVNGQAYVITSDAAIADLPAEVAALLNRKREREWSGASAPSIGDVDTPRQKQAARSYLRSEPPAVEGERSNRAFAIACRVMDFGISADVALVLLGDWNDRCAPPLDDDELETIVHNAAQYRKTPIGSDDPAEGFEPVTVADSAREIINRATGIVSRSAASITPKNIEWLWSDRIPRGKLWMLAGHGDLGKTTVLLYIAANISKGGKWPDGTPCPQGRVIYVSAEDAADDTIVPRLMAAHADLDNVQLIEATRREDGKGIRTFDLNADIDKLEKLCDALGNVAMIIFDPISSYMGGKVDGRQTIQVRNVLEPLQRFAERTKIAVLMNNHFRKSGGGRATDRIMDSAAFPNLCRVVYIVAPDPEDDENRLFLPSKFNVAPKRPGFSYRIKATYVVDNADILGTYCDWGGEVAMTANEAVAAIDEASKPKARSVARDGAQEFLSEYLANGPKPSSEVIDAGIAAGHTDRTLRRAREAMGVKVSKAGMSAPWIWSLDISGGHF